MYVEVKHLPLSDWAILRHSLTQAIQIQLCLSDTQYIDN